jgi:hypothetical protein
MEKCGKQLEKKDGDHRHEVSHIDMGWPNLLVRDAMMMMMVADDTIGDKLVSPMNSPR